jgi:hypothetical protein
MGRYGIGMNERMDRRGFFSRILLLLGSAVLAGLGMQRPGRGRILQVSRTSRKKADHWKELAG